jgi:gluconokinase
MAASTRSSTKGPLIISLDVGSSSVRTLVLGQDGRWVDGLGEQVSYDFETTPDGGVEIDASALLGLTKKTLDDCRDQLKQKGMTAAAVAASGFWHSFLGVDANGEPVTPVMHLLDTRATAEVRWLKCQLDQRATHSRVGCVFHTSYWPARLLWIKKNRPEAWLKAARWMSFGEFLMNRLLGQGVESTSMMSASGLWDQNQNDYDAEVLDLIGLKREQLADPASMDQPVEHDGLAWHPMIGDGAANNIGSGCMTRDRFGLMVGTTGAMRAVIESPQLEIPWGAWCYRIDRKRFVIGGALSDGGKVFEWMTERLAGLPEGDDLEAALAGMKPGAHGLTFLPLFAGERSPNWNADARAVIAGISLHTTPLDLLRASLEAVALRFRMIYDILIDRVGEPADVVASGGALLRSRAWTQMMADALGRPVIPCLENETSSRGAALLVLEKLGQAELGRFATDLGPAIEPLAGHENAYAEMLDNQKHLYGHLYP